jgi:hypothetical protein
MKNDIKTEYDIQAENFLESTQTSIDMRLIGFDSMPFDTDGTKRDVYEITIKNNKHNFVFKFGQSVINSSIANLTILQKQNLLMPYSKRVTIAELQKEIDKHKAKRPNYYDILACLNINYCEDFEEFCQEFGYDDDSIKALDTYRAVQNESSNLKKLFNDKQLEQLQDIN